MKTIETTNKIPTTMTMTVNAVWNEDKNLWEVGIFEVHTGICAKTNEPLYTQRKSTMELCDECDEYVIPVAIMEHNGIDSGKVRFVEID